MNRDAIIERMKTDKSYSEGVEAGRVSVLSDFDSMCMADSFVGFNEVEWSAIKRFFEFNKQISGWDK